MVIPENASQEDLQDECGALSEWLAMVSIESPRILTEDNVDPYLSRYCVPDVERAKPSNLVSLKWHGFATAKWIMQLFFELLVKERGANSLRLHGRCSVGKPRKLKVNLLGKEAVEGKDGYTILALPAPAAERSPTALSSNGAEKTNDPIQPRKSRNSICWDFVGASVI
ncbi:hypothetical protein PHISCL_03466 [Aspergillus sclerotialis]|uniref:Uncharacterized protein n=1 Tax=Aspergillus sclerotialis TaxID=2070753 RepID=A0A3A2ZLV8_9EURO|nr:hypothetical protein PHISCL_03466 [Aspergillus sclerotialis]